MIIKKILENSYNKNTIFLLAQKVLALPINLISFIIMARYFGPHEFGLISFGLAFLALFAPFSKFAYETIITRYLSVGYLFSNLWKVSIKLRLAGSLIVYITLVFTAFVTQSDHTILLFISLIGLTLFLDVFVIYDSLFQAYLKSKYSTLSGTIGLVVGSLLRIVIAIYLHDIIWIACSFILDRLIAIYLMFYYSKRIIEEIEEKKVLIPSAKQLLMDSVPIILTNFFILINFKIDQILIQYYMTMDDVGVYSAAVRISEVWYVLPTAVMTSYFPFLSKNIGNEELISKIILKLSRYLIFAALLLAVTTSFGSAFILDQILGHTYLPSAGILSIHIWASIFFFAGHPISKVLIAKNLTWINLVGKIGAALINVGLNIWLIPTIGLKGAAIATLISYAIGYYVYYFLFRETRGMIWGITLSPLKYVIYMFASSKNKSI